jgi:hypothetical protein
LRLLPITHGRAETVQHCESSAAFADFKNGASLVRVAWNAERGYTVKGAIAPFEQPSIGRVTARALAETVQ